MLSTLAGLPGDCVDWMGKDCGSWLHHQFEPWKSPNINCTNVVPDLGATSAFTNPFYFMVCTDGSLTAPAPSNLMTCSKPGQANGHSLIHCLYHQNESLTPNPKTVISEKLSNLSEHQEATSNAMPGASQKRFLVFNQSGNEGDLVFSSMIGSPLPPLNLGTSTPMRNGGSHQDKLATEFGLARHPWSIFSDKLKEDQGISEESEMHEDTEELDALLYSDGDSDYEDEETSTGHSPSEITGEKKQKVACNAEFVASATKRKRLPDDEEHDISVMDTASSVETHKLSETEDDAEWSFVNGTTQGKRDSSLTNKWTKRQKIQDLVSIMQSIIPGGKGKDTVFVLDEAIDYLKSLKLKAKSLGLTMDQQQQQLEVYNNSLTNYNH